MKAGRHRTPQTEWLRPPSCEGSGWPETVTVKAWLDGPPTSAHPGRPSWCYGTPGIARSLQLAALSTERVNVQHRAEEALSACATSPEQLARLHDATLCHR
ncbi:lanthionine synthetase LanC family protein [Streptomyces sp. NPDC055078]